MTIAKGDPAIQKAAGLIRDAHHLVFFTGAGISTPSGVPDFRSPATGLWEREDPMEVASLSSFRARPERFYAWLRPLADRIFQASPNPAHTSIAELQRAGYGEGVITQNIDGLHQRSGSYPVFELHGTLHTISCPRCEKTYPSQPALPAFIASGTIPICPQCGAVLKPDIVLFEEALPWMTWRSAQEMTETCDVMLIIGSSLNVIPAASLPQIAAQNGARLVILNYDPTPLDSIADVVISDNCAEILPLITSQVLQLT